MEDTVVSQHDIETKTDKTPIEHREFLGYEDPHKAALEDNPEHAEKLTLSVVLSALFLGTSFTGPIIFGFILCTPILVQLSEKIGGSTIDFWIPSGWGAAAAVGFSIAGRLSDIFGRRPVILFGQALTILGGIVACTANTMNQLIAGEVILGASIGTISVAYAGEFNHRAATPCTDRNRHIRDPAKQVPRHRSSMDRVQPVDLGDPRNSAR